MNEHKQATIYALLDPTNKKVKYIGWTCRDLSIRLSEHISDSRSFGAKSKNHRCNWIRKLEKSGLLPEILEIETTTIEDAQNREIFWISFYGRENLVNGTDGGEGCLGRICEESTREKISLSKKGKSTWNKGIPMKESTKLKLSASKKGRVGSWLGRHHTEESRKKLSLAQMGKTPSNKGKKMSEEQKIKISKSKIANMNELTRKKLSDALKGRDCPTKFTKLNVGGKSKYYGVIWNSSLNMWLGRISIDGKRIQLCRSVVEKDCAVAFDIGLLYFYGNEKYKLNFPEYLEIYVGAIGSRILTAKEIRSLVRDVNIFISQQEGR